MPKAREAHKLDDTVVFTTRMSEALRRAINLKAAFAGKTTEQVVDSIMSAALVEELTSVHKRGD